MIATARSFWSSVLGTPRLVLNPIPRAFLAAVVLSGPLLAGSPATGRRCIESHAGQRSSRSDRTQLPGSSGDDSSELPGWIERITTGLPGHGSCA